MSNRFTRKTGWLLTLLLMWILFAQRLDYQTLATGVIVSAVIVVVNDNLLLSLGSDLHVTPRTIMAWVAFWGSMIVEIFKAGWQVARLAFAPRLSLSPGFVSYDPELKEQMMRVSLANSITLTPGTLTVEAPDEGLFVIHVLTEESGEGLKGWHIQQRLAAMERKN